MPPGDITPPKKQQVPPDAQAPAVFSARLRCVRALADKQHGGSFGVNIRCASQMPTPPVAAILPAPSRSPVSSCTKKPFFSPLAPPPSSSPLSLSCMQAALSAPSLILSCTLTITSANSVSATARSSMPSSSLSSSARPALSSPPSCPAIPYFSPPVALPRLAR